MYIQIKTRGEGRPFFHFPFQLKKESLPMLKIIGKKFPPSQKKLLTNTKYQSNNYEIIIDITIYLCYNIFVVVRRSLSTSPAVQLREDIRFLTEMKKTALWKSKERNETQQENKKSP